MNVVQNVVKKFKLDKITGYNTANSNWAEGVDYWFNLLEAIPCVYNDGQQEVQAYCDMINVYHHPQSNNDEFLVFFGLKDVKDKQVNNIDDYILAKTYEDDNENYVELISLDKMQQPEIKLLELYFFKKAYYQHFAEEKNINIKEILKRVKEVEVEFYSNINLTIKDIIDFIESEEVSYAWQEEKYNEETGEGWMRYEDFLIDFIQQYIMFEEYNVKTCS